jgi:hypothetical protein
MAKNSSCKEQWEIMLHIFQETCAKPKLVGKRHNSCSNHATTQFITHKNELCLS